LIVLGNQLPPIERIPFSSPKMNYLTRGGMPRGRMVEFVGMESSGKTTTTLDLIAQCQEAGGRAFFVDAENTLDEDWAKKLGVDVDNLVLIKPTHGESAEEILQAVIDLVSTGLFSMGAVDSIPFLVPKAVIEGTMDDKSYCGNSGTLTQFVNKINGLLAKTGTLLVMINQLRDKIGATYVAYNTPGGRALKHAYSFRLFFTKGRFINEDCKELTNQCETAQGNIVEVKVEKNKVCKPDRRLGQYTLKYDTGIDVYNDTIEMGIQLKTGIYLGGSWYYIINADGEPMKDGENELKFQGKAKLLERLGADDILFRDVYDRVCAAAAVD
jgi:recombination protein RecA